MGMDPLPEYVEPVEFAGRKNSGEVVLISGASHHYVSSSLANVSKLMSLEGRAFVEVSADQHPDHAVAAGAGLDAARTEIARSRTRLEEELDARITMFSYPNGGAERYMTREIADLVRGHLVAGQGGNFFVSAGVGPVAAIKSAAPNSTARPRAGRPIEDRPSRGQVMNDGYCTAPSM